MRHIGTPGQAWGDAERAQWRARQMRQRSYADDVLTAIDALRSHFDVQTYGELRYGNEHHAQERFSLMALRSRIGRAICPACWSPAVCMAMRPVACTARCAFCKRMPLATPAG